MFRYSLLLDTLFKALTHKYIRRVPKGVTKTGATKYMYFYAGQEGHGKGIGHESELVTGASFAFGEHGKTRYHAHITKVDGDKVTVKYDDGDKKGTEETMTNKQFQALVHGEHKEAIKQAQVKAEKQLKDFQAGKEKGVKVKQETLDKLEQRVKNLDELTKKPEDPKIEEPIKPDTNTQDIKDKIKDILLGDREIGKFVSNKGYLNQSASKTINKLATIVKMSKGLVEGQKPFKITKEMLSNILNGPTDAEAFFDMDAVYNTIFAQNKTQLTAPQVVQVFGESKTARKRRQFLTNVEETPVDNFIHRKRTYEHILTSDNTGVMSFIRPEIIKDTFITNTLFEAVKQLEQGDDVNTVQQKMKQHLLNVAQEIINKKIDQAEKTEVKTETPKQNRNIAEEPAKDVLKTLSMFVNTQPAYKNHLLSSIMYHPLNNSLLASDGILTVVVQNPNNIQPATSFSSDSENASPIAIDKKDLKNLTNSKTSTITIKPENGYIDSRINNIFASVDTIITTPPEQQIAFDLPETIKDAISKVQAPNIAKYGAHEIKFVPKNNMLQVYHIGKNTKTNDIVLNTKLGEIPITTSTSQSVRHFGYDADHLKAILPFTKNIIFNASKERSSSTLSILNGYSDQVNMLLSPKYTSITSY